MSDIDCRIAALYLHPIKSCRGVVAREGLLIETGFEFDRAWMLVDADANMLTQRAWPRLALVRPTLRLDDMVLRAPGMLALHVSLDAVEQATRVRVWNDVVKAYDMGALAAQWFSDFVGAPTRLVRFDPAEKRRCDRRWTGAHEAETAFADGFPLLVASNASLAELNGRLVSSGHAAVGIERFRPNLVLDGLQAFEEDYIDELSFESTHGEVRLKLVKPCVRCTIPNVDPASADVGAEPLATLAGFRADARMNGGITFGMNAIVVDGIDRTLQTGAAGRASVAF